MTETVYFVQLVKDIEVVLDQDSNYRVLVLF
jgi:hypothetical protein